MYCKYCGSVLADDSIQCRICGAKIDTKDGGQSFFEDGEIEEWKTNISVNTTIIPKTEDIEEDIQEKVSPHYTSALPITMTMNEYTPAKAPLRRRSHAGDRLKKQSLGFRKRLLLQPNILISVCVAVTLILAMLIIGITIIVNNTQQNNDETVSETEYGIYISQLGNYQLMEKSTLYDMNNDRREIQNKMYKIDGVLYIPFDDFMSCVGYTIRNSSEKNHVEFEKDGRVVGVVKGTADMYIEENNECREMQLGLNVYNLSPENETTYVPARYFFENMNIGFEEDEDGSVRVHMVIGEKNDGM